MVCLEKVLQAADSVTPPYRLADDQSTSLGCARSMGRLQQENESERVDFSGWFSMLDCGRVVYDSIRLHVLAAWVFCTIGGSNV